MTHDINTGDAVPVKQRPRCLAPHRRDLIVEEGKGMLEKGVIEESASPWASPVVIVTKKDGSRQFCVDYRRLNDVMRKDAYPIPRIDDSLDTLAGAGWFTTLDLSSGYWQVGMADKNVEKTAFVTHGGLYQYRVMSFGLCNAPSTFERLMEVVLMGMHWKTCLIYLDDIIVFLETFKAHLEQVEAVLLWLMKAGLKLKPRKCQLARQEVTFLGHIVRKEGVNRSRKDTRGKRVAAPQNGVQYTQLPGAGGLP